MSIKIKLGLLIILILMIAPVFGQTSDLSDKIQQYQLKLKQLQQQKNTLSSQIQYMDTQISLTELTIVNTEQKVETTAKEINTLETRISGLDSSLNYLSGQFVKRIAQGYKNRSVSFFSLIFDANNVKNLFSRIKYFKSTQDNNQKILVQVQEAKLNFEEQKKLREKKIKELDDLRISLERQRVDLANQKGAKQKLLAETQNNEKIYQDLLAKAQREYSAIQGIVSGGGQEKSLGEVKKGNFIANIISGPSCNSGGGHVHFIVKDNGTVVNPLSYLKPVDYSNCSGSSCGSSDGDPFNPVGSLDWPLAAPIELEQGYGETWAVKNTWAGRIYNFHNGIDINGSSDEVRAIDDGVLYQGNFSGSNGCVLPYVKLVHKNSNITTYYLHVYTL